MVNAAQSSRVRDLGVLGDAGPRLADVAGHYPWPADRTFVRSNFVTTVDGAAQGSDGRSGTINTDADHLVFDALRATCDVVVAGAGTVRREGYRAVELSDDQQSVRGPVRPEVPSLLVVSASLDLPAELTAGAGEVHVVTGSASPSARAETLVRQGVRVHRTALPTVLPGDVLELCRAHGWARILLEGGPHLHGEFLAAGLVDEICLSLAPRVVAGDRLGIVATPALQPPADLRVAGLLLLDETIMVRWARADEASDLS